MTARSPDYQALLLRTLLFFLLLRIGSTEEVEVLPNNVVGDPFVNCAADAIYVKFKTNATFVGHVNVKFTPNKYCYQVLVTNNQIELLIPHEECAVMRKRSFHPAGIIMEASVSVSFHPEFTTSDDRMFNFHCFHVQKTKGQGLEIGSATQPPPELLPGPQCSYSILRSPGGRVAGTVALGQTLYHEWSCQQTKDTCLVVRNCVLVGGDSRHSLIGADGCSRDTKLLPQLEYGNRSYVSQSVAVFGLSSSSLVYFECELLLLPKTGENCHIPQCHANRTRRSALEPHDEVMEVRSQRIEISELDSQPEDPPLPPSLAKCDESRMVETSDDVCVSVSVLAITLALITCIGLFVLFIASLAMLQRYRYYNVAQTAS